jgi:hypothetical protein
MKRVKRGQCRRCGKFGATEWHHIFGGPQRKAAEREGLVIELCHDCHLLLHRDAKEWMVYKKRAQRAWETIGKHNRALWMTKFHKNYLDLEDE